MADNQLPSAVRFFLRSVVGSAMGDKQDEQPPFTEKDMTEGELAAIRVAIRKARKEGRDYISYEDYPTEGKWWVNRGSMLGELDAVMSDPARSAMFSLGMAQFDENGVVVDSYDFAASPKEKFTMRKAVKSLMETQPNNPRAVLNLIGNAVGLRSGQGRSVRINTGETK